MQIISLYEKRLAVVQLGNGTTSYATSPVKVVGLEDLPIADISAGGWHSLALTTTGGALRLRHPVSGTLPHPLLHQHFNPLVTALHHIITAC